VIGRCAFQLRHSVSAGSLLAPTTGRCCNNDSSCDVINGTPSSSSSSSAQQLQSTRDHLIVRVFLQTDDTHETINYKSILVRLTAGVFNSSQSLILKSYCYCIGAVAICQNYMSKSGFAVKICSHRDVFLCWKATSKLSTRSSATAERQRVSCPHRGGTARPALQPTLPPPPLATPMHMVESETRNKLTSSVPSIKRTLGWIGHSRSFKVILIGGGRNPERCVVVMCN